MKKQPLSENDLDKILTDLSESARTPCGNFSAEESYKKLEERFTKKKVKFFPFFRYAAAASVLFIIALSAYLFSETGTVEMVTLSTTDQIREIILPDGSNVVLSHYSSITYPCEFKGDTRNVILQGEGYFDVSKDKEHPFIVEAHDIQVKVLGTQFNIQAYSNDPDIKTTLLEGSVAISNIRNDNSIILQPDETGIFCKESAKLYQKSNPNAKDDIAWRNNNIIFNDLALSQIATNLSNYYNIEIKITDNNLKKYKLTARFENGESLDDILSLLQAVGNFSYTKNSRAIIIEPK